MDPVWILTSIVNRHVSDELSVDLRSMLRLWLSVEHGRCRDHLKLLAVIPTWTATC